LANRKTSRKNRDDLRRKAERLLSEHPEKIETTQPEDLRALLHELGVYQEELEMRVQKRTAELRKTNNALEQRNKELQAFAFIASHDLQEPLRKIQAFGNLLVGKYSDSLKFYKPGNPPMVRISSRLEADQCEIYVEDDGIGFDRQNGERIFSPFERLHGRGEYEGVGMGLAICGKIVERHRGSITARSIAGKGSTFVITLPTSHDVELWILNV
jgi:light-regulated signal transduction histidine kinase (bacteriophytochrome)